MPKIKTHKATAKRFKRSDKGKLRRTRGAPAQVVGICATAPSGASAKSLEWPRLPAAEISST